jgi:hypothetical protein
MRIHFSALSLALAGFLCAAGCETLDEPESTLQEVNLFGKVVVLIIDNSAGPEEWDPRGYIAEGSKFLIATLNREDNIGLVTCRFPAAVPALTQTIQTTDRRAEMFGILDALELGGESRYADALRLASQLLKTFSDNSDSTVVFLTGGKEKPVADEKEMDDLMRLYARNGWRIFPVVLAPTGHMPLLEKMAVHTRGAVFKVEKPEHLLTSLAAVSAEINHRMIRRSLDGPNTLLPGASGLLVAVTNRGEETGIAQMLLDGKPLPMPSGEGGLDFKSKGYFHVVHLRDAKPGAYEVRMSGEAIDRFLFLDSPFEVRMNVDTAAGKVKEGEPLRLSLSIETPSKDPLKTLMEKAVVTAAIMSERTGKTVAEIALKDFSLSGNRVEYEGRVRLVTSDPGTEETFTACIVLRVREEGMDWSLERHRSFSVRPAAPLLFQVTPPEIDFGLLWADDRQAVARISVTARAAHGLRVEVAETTGGVVVTPTEAVSIKDRPMVFTVRLSDAPDAPAETGRGSLRIKASSAAQGELRFEKSVPVLFQRITYQGTGDITLDGLVPGEEKRVDLEFATDPVIGLTVKAENLLGPAVIPVRMEGEGARRTLVVSVPQGCSPGVFIGRIVVQPQGLGLSPRIVKVEGRIPPPVDQPLAGEGGRRPKLSADPIRLTLTTATDGWVEGLLALALEADDPSATIVGVERTSLGGAEEFQAISGEFDFLTRPGPGWDGKQVMPGRNEKLEYRIFISSDLPDGRYEGKIVISYKGQGEEEFTLEVPVEITVDRSGE